MMFGIPAAVILAFGFSAYLTRRFCNPDSRFHLLDHPNERSLHTRPTPRTGGVAIVTAILFATPAWLFVAGTAAELIWLLAAAGVIAMLSFLDDRHGLPVGVRLLGHAVGAALAVFGAGLSLSSLLPEMSSSWPDWLGPGLSVFFLVWMVNLYNFMDGMDGFAGGMALIGFGVLATFGFLAGNLPFAVLSLIIAAAAGGFLPFNFPPARIFMGDTGSAVLGLLAGGLSLWGARNHVFPLWAALLVFSPFIVDASVTLARRLLRGERVWQAHKTHYYQRLVQSGWGHRKTVLYEYGLMLACGASALFGRQLDWRRQGALVLIWAVVYLALMTWVHRMDKKEKS